MRSFLSILFSLSLLSARAATYYVDFAGGSDSNAGTSSGVAWQHCPGDANATGSANITLSAGDTVYFKRGVTYVGMVTSVSGSSGSPITYTTNSSFGSGIAVWDAGTNLVMLTSGTPLRADWNTVSGILFQNMPNPTNGAAIYYYAQQGLKILNCTFSNVVSSPITLAVDCRNTEIANNYCISNGVNAGAGGQGEIVIHGGSTTGWSDGVLVHDNYIDGYASSRDSGILAAGQFIQVYSNTLVGVQNTLQHGDGIVIQPDAGTLGYSANIRVFANRLVDDGNFIYVDGVSGAYTISNVWIYNNVEIATALSTGQSPPIGVALAHSGGAILRNIYAFNNSGYGLTGGFSVGGITGSGSGNYFATNNVWESCFNGVVVSSSSTATNLQSDFNIFHASSGSDVNYQGSALTLSQWQATPYFQDAHSISGDPKYVSATDLHIQSGSAAIGIGTNLTALGLFTTDADNATRPPTGAWTVGAYQSTSVNGSTLKNMRIRNRP